MFRFKDTKFIYLPLSACLLIGAGEWMGADMHNILGAAAYWLASQFTPAPSPELAGTDRIVLTGQLYSCVHLVLIALFTASLVLLTRPRGARSQGVINALLLVQAFIATLTMASLAFLTAAQLPVVQTWKRALAWLVGLCVLRLGGGIWLIFFGGMQMNDDKVMRIFLTLSVEVGIHVVAFAISCLVLRERRTREALAVANAELLATQTLLSGTVRASERLRIARDLHDVVGHHLTALNLHLDLAVRQTENPGQSLQTSRELARSLLAEVRVVVSDERSVPNVDLHAALRTLCTGVPRPVVDLHVDDDLSVHSPTLAHAVFCCVQEALSNVMRHADATKASVRLALHGGQLRVQVDDDGRGSRGAQHGNGLQGMRERVDAMGGTLRAADGVKHGYAIEILLPFAEVAQ